VVPKTVAYYSLDPISVYGKLHMLLGDSQTQAGLILLISPSQHQEAFISGFDRLFKYPGKICCRQQTCGAGEILVTDKTLPGKQIREPGEPDPLHDER